jgi:nicotinamide riboside kinase
MSNTEIREDSALYKTNVENYEKCKHTLKTLIDNNVKTIILLGTGANGKSYLLNDMRNYIETNDYMCYHESPGLYDNSSDFQKYFSLLNEKKVICYNFNPYLKHNMEKPNDVVIIDMEFIRFRHY